MEDKYLWLEEVLGEKALGFVSELSDKTIEEFKKHPLFSEIESKACNFFSTKEKIPYVWFENGCLINHWIDDQNPQGLIRKTSVEAFLNKEVHWEVLLDLDLLSKNEKEKWVFKGIDFSPSHKNALIFLSPGGTDANVVREFDLEKKIFLPDGFYLPLSKGGAHYVNENLIRIERKFDEESVTNSGYARTVRELSRGQKYESAKILFEIKKEDMYAYSKKLTNLGQEYFFLGRVIDFYNIEEFIYIDNKTTKLNLPTMVEDHGIINGKYICTIKCDWNGFLLGDVLEYDLKTHHCKKIFSPKENQSFYNIQSSQDGLFLIIDEDVTSSLYFAPQEKNYELQKISLPINGSIDFLTVDKESNQFFVSFNSFNKPATYYYGKESKVIKEAKTAPSFFDHESIAVKQHFVKSVDGTKIPYFVVHKNNLEYNGKNPTILYGYGGFEISLKPTFSNGIGSSWLDKGGVYVLSNIRGGGEYGPKWHHAALKNNRQKAYDDFFSIAEELIQLKITSNKNLGAWGGSNGGLLMGVCYTQRPDLFAAINCAVPLLDMHRYHKLLAGASWVAEYGNPEDEVDGAYIKKISPYQNIKKDQTYPTIFINTSTKDDRVHPGHARKFAAKILEYGHPLFYYENIDGGHAGASNYREQAFKHALDMIFFWNVLK